MESEKEYELFYSTMWNNSIPWIFDADSDEDARRKVPEIIEKKQSESWGQGATAVRLYRWDYEADKSKRDFRHRTEISLV